MAIVLASQSPRRQELLARIGVEDFKTLSLDIDESYPEGLSPEDTVRYIAKKKCDAAAALCSPDDLIITADTMVFLGNDRLGKPHDEDDALRMLRELAGRGHTVCTGVSVRRGAQEERFAVSTRVFFRPATETRSAPTSRPASRWTKPVPTACRAAARSSSSASTATFSTSWDFPSSSLA